MREARGTWARLAVERANPYVDYRSLLLVGRMALEATRWADGLIVLAAIAKRMDSKSSPRWIPEWARELRAERIERDRASAGMTPLLATPEAVLSRLPADVAAGIRERDRARGATVAPSVPAPTRYEAYMASSAWSERRAAYFALHMARCVCGNRFRIELHHKTYARLGREQNDDLVPLCETCHDRVHSRADVLVTQGMEPWEAIAKASDHFAATPRDPVSEHEPVGLPTWGKICEATTCGARSVRGEERCERHLPIKQRPMHQLGDAMRAAGL